VYAIVAGITGVAVDAFYRRVALPGAGEIPATGPVLLVANHPNGLIDPIVVANVVRDEAARQGVKRRAVRILAKAPLFEMPGISLLVKGAGALPVYRAKDGADTAQNQATFRAVTDALLEQSAVLVFPEGISHDEPQLQRLKTGAARMALLACDAGAAELVIVPIGLVYRDKERFRSEVATVIGAPIPVRPYLESAAEPGDASVVKQLTEDIAAGLARTTVNLEEWEDLPLLEAVDAIWRIDDPSRTARIKQLAEGVQLLRTFAPERLDAARAMIVEWTERLDELGLEPRDLSPEHAAARAAPRRALTFGLRNLFIGLVGLPVATFGALFFAAPFWTVHLLYLLARPGRDVAATVKVLASLVFFPAWHALATFAMWRLFGPSVAFTVAGLSPFAGMSTRWFFRGRKRALRDAAAFVSLFLRRGLATKLEAERDALVREIDGLGRLVEELRGASVSAPTRG
jgi:glycerol-3-phosphate O-acyltransferase / dihydroxyacetone phosphate acyltransferase